MHYISLKHQWTCAEVCGITSQKLVCPQLPLWECKVQHTLTVDFKTLYHFSDSNLLLPSDVTVTKYWRCASPLLLADSITYVKQVSLITIYRIFQKVWSWPTGVVGDVIWRRKCKYQFFQFTIVISLRHLKTDSMWIVKFCNYNMESVYSDFSLITRPF
jgi:hypothetical protein